MNHMKETKSAPQTYQPINCNYYDELEAMATLRKVVNIEFYGESGESLSHEGQIIDFRIKEGAEYMILKDGKEIRLDDLIAVDGKPLPNAC